MSFNPGGGGGSSSIAGATDVALSSVQTSQVLAYDGAANKWGNQDAGAVLPSNLVMATTGTTRPTADPSITVIFKGADPGNNALDGDIWLGA